MHDDVVAAHTATDVVKFLVPAYAITVMGKSCSTFE